MMTFLGWDFLEFLPAGALTMSHKEISLSKRYELQESLVITPNCLRIFLAPK
jgi:hypothetical protein